MNPIKSGFCARYLKAKEIKNLANISPFSKSKDRCPMRDVTIVLDSGPRCLRFVFFIIITIMILIKMMIIISIIVIVFFFSFF